MNADNDRLTTNASDGLVIIDNRSIADISNTIDLGPSYDTNLVMDIKDASNIRKASLIKDFNNGVPLVILIDLSYIISDKDDIKFFARNIANVISFEDLIPMMMAL